MNLKKASSGFSGKMTVLSLDVTKEDSVKRCFEQVTRALNGKGLWGLVCNAGIGGSFGPDDWQQISDYQSCLDVNALGIVRTCQTFKPLIKKSKGRIVIVTSVFGKVATPGTGPYTMSKYAAEAYADTLRRELVHFGVSVHILSPGYFKTEITNTDTLCKSLERTWTRLTKEQKDEYGQQFITESKDLMIKAVNTFASPQTHLVVDAYFHALTSKLPRKRYYPGYDACTMFRLLTVLPDCLQDFIFHQQDKWLGAPLPACLKQ